MNCHVCGKSSHETALFQQNEKGVPGIWACEAHNTKEIDPVVKEITDLVSKAAP